MKLSIRVGDLQGGLAMVGAVVPSTTVIPILQTVKFEAENDNLFLSANNIETAVSHKVLADVETDGAICVPYRHFAGWLAAMNDDETVLIEADYETYSIKAVCGKFNTGFRGFDVSEFPLDKVDNETASFSIDADELKRLIDNTVFSTSTDESRPALKGLNFTADDVLTVVAADGFRLAIDVADLDADFSEVISVTPTGDSIKVLQKVLSKTLGAVICNVFEGKLTFETGADVVSCVLIDAEYPNITQIIPTNHPNKIVINKKQLQQVVLSAAVFTRDAADIIVFDVADNVLTCQAKNSQVGPFEVDLSVEYDGEPCSFGLNRSYLAQVLNVVEGDSVILNFDDGDKPFVIKGDGPALFLIMPMNIR